MRWLRAISAHGVLSALVMNVCLFTLPFAAVQLHLSITEGDIYSYEATPNARNATRAVIEHRMVALLPRGLDRRRGWEELVARELREGDPYAARGFVLAAPALLGPMDIARIRTNPDAQRGDDGMVRAATALLSNETRDDFAAVARWMEGQDNDPAAFLVLGETRDLAQQARAWAGGRESDHLVLVLTGIGAAMETRVSRRAALGASALKDARRSGRLSPALARDLERMAAAAAPPERLRANIQAALAHPDALTREYGLIAQAFRNSIEHAAFEHFASRLGAIGDIAAATSSRGAARLLARAESEHDLLRLRLIAQSAGDRAVAVAKRMPEDAPPLATAARGAIVWTRDLVLNLIGVAAALLGLIGAAIAVLAQAIVRRWRGSA